MIIFRYNYSMLEFQKNKITHQNPTKYLYIKIEPKIAPGKCLAAFTTIVAIPSLILQPHSTLSGLERPA